MSALKDKSHGVRVQAARALSAIHTPSREPVFAASAKEVVPALIEALRERDSGKDPVDSVACLAATGLERFGARARDAIPPLLQVLRERHYWRLHGCVLAALGRIGPRDERVRPVLLAAMKDERLRAAAAVALGEFGPMYADEAIPELLHALDVRRVKDKDRADLIQYHCLRSLQKLQAPSSVMVPKLEGLLRDPETGWNTRTEAQRALKTYRPGR